MGYSTALPLFRISGFGPLGLPLTAQAYGADFTPLSTSGNPQSGTAGAFLSAGLSQTVVSSSGLAGGGRNRLFAGAADGTTGRSSLNQPPKSFVLKFLTTSGPGRASFVLGENREIIIGREPGLDLVLPEDGVARRHAKISVKDGKVTVEDLGSVAKIFINSSQVNKAELKVGDRIVIGTVILRLDTANESAPVSSPPSQQVTIPPPPSPRSASKRMSGMIEEIPLPDLLQTMAVSRKSGVVVIESDRGLGKIYLRDGRVSYCSINDSAALNPQKAFYRLLTWAQGVFNLEPPFTGNLPEDINASIESLLMEGVYQSDEIKRIEADAPSPGSKLAPNLKAGSLSDLNADDRHVLQVVLAYGTLEGVLDHYLGSDLQAYTSLISLVGKGFVVAS